MFGFNSGGTATVNATCSGNLVFPLTFVILTADQAEAVSLVQEVSVSRIGGDSLVVSLWATSGISCMLTNTFSWNRKATRVAILPFHMCGMSERGIASLSTTPRPLGTIYGLGSIVLGSSCALHEIFRPR